MGPCKVLKASSGVTTRHVPTLFRGQAQSADCVQPDRPDVNREWSETATLELSAPFDVRGNAIGLTVGSNQSGDFSYVRRLDTDPDLTRLGFRIALLPNQP